MVHATKINLLDGLAELLRATAARRTKDFSGVGLIVYEDADQLPIYPLRRSETYSECDATEDAIAAISAASNVFHDGFHLISVGWKITHLSQYFSPPIVHGLHVKEPRIVGGRYMAALFGSCVQGVVATGILGSDLKMAVFAHGHEITFETLQ